MKIYMVGGAIRDILLGLPIKDRDWVVVGATPKEMIKLGYQKIGNNFPVFLHPKSREEYALARTEYKSNFGYKGFFFYTTPNVTLEQDLSRRDLTINAMAQENNGNLIDPYGGQKDLKNRLLRHISSSFSEDPLRVLRVARFAARYRHLNFRIANETMELMKTMVETGELYLLTPERIWKETKNALSTFNPHIYFQVLRKCGALKIIFPEIDALFGTKMLDKHHLKIDTGIHTLITLSRVATLSTAIEVRFATLCHNLEKTLILKDLKKRYHHYSVSRKNIIEKLCQRLRVPNEIRDVAKFTAEFYNLVHIFSTLNPETIINFFDSIDAWRKPQRIEQIALASEANIFSRMNIKAIDYLQSKLLREAWIIANSVSKQEIIKAGFKGFKIREELTKRRIQAITFWKKKRFYRSCSSNIENKNI